MPNAQITVRVTGGNPITYPDNNPDVIVTGATDINFVLTNPNAYEWANPAINIDPNTGGFTPNAPNGATLQVEDTDTDGTSVGVPHEYTLYLAPKSGGAAIPSDPQIINRR